MERPLSLTWITFVAASLTVGHVVSGDQDTINYLASHLKVELKVIDNFVNSWYNFSGMIYLTNSGEEAIESTATWSLHFCSVRLMQPEEIRPHGSYLGTSGLKVYHTNGCLHKITPDADIFGGLQPGQRLEVPFEASYWMISRTDAMPNWYVTSPGFEARTVESTAGEDLAFVANFTSKKQWKRLPEDQYDPFSPSYRLELQDYSDLGHAPTPIIPTAVQETLDSSDRLSLSSGDWVVVLGDDTLAVEGNYLASMLQTVVVDDDVAPSNRYIFVDIGDVILDGSPINVAEGYKLRIDTTEEKIFINGTDSAGVFYGIQSLLSLHEEAEGIPSGDVTDYPRFHFRGMHIDVSRNFHDKGRIMKVLDVMSMYKLNKFHFHLSDDEGWRLDIPGLPELTQVGSRRCHDETGDQCLLPQLGSNPGPSNDGSGYYTREDYQEILQFAQDRHIEVIPEFDTPGHAHAAINAMLARYRKYKDTNVTAATEYLLNDMEDQSEYLSVQYFTDSALNPCVQSAYTFLGHVIREVANLHTDIQPLRTFHFGGDEVPEGAWVESPACETLRDREGFNSSWQLKEYFARKVAELVHANGLDLAGWEDGLMEGTEPFDLETLATDTVYSNVWNNVWEWGTGQRAYLLANAGYKVILSPATHLYFDHPYEPDPEERGYYWATRIAPTRKAFGYSPDRLYDNIDLDRMGNPLDRDQICADYGCTPLDEDKADNILGIQGHLWSETVRKQDQLEYMIFPRLVALAERAWHKASWEETEDEAVRDAERTEDWERFANSLGYKEFARLDKMDVHYRITPPGAQIHGDNKLDAMSEFPGLPMEYSLDSGATWRDYKADYIVPGDTDVFLRSRSADHSRTSSEVSVRSGPVTSAAVQTTHAVGLASLATLLTFLCAAL